MTMNIRRIVTAHDSEGKAIIQSDEVMDNVHPLRSGNLNSLIWVTDETPCDVDGEEDPAKRAMDIEPPHGGSVFRILELMPNKEAYMHRTDTIDYAIIMSGECVMLMDDSEVEMRAGDVLVQKGTWHGWANRTDTPCRIAFVLISSNPPAKHLHG